MQVIVTITSLTAETKYDKFLAMATKKSRETILSKQRPF